MQTFPVVWPLGSGDRFAGVVDRLDRKVHLYTKSGREGKAKGAVTEMLDLDDDLERLRELVPLLRSPQHRPSVRARTDTTLPWCTCPQQRTCKAPYLRRSV